MNPSGEGSYQRRILRAIKEHGWLDGEGRRCCTLPTLREIIYGRRRPGWTQNWTLERALRSLEARGRIQRVYVDVNALGVRPCWVVQYLRPNGIPDGLGANRAAP